MDETNQIPTPRQPYDRQAGGTKPKNIHEVRVGGWVELCIGEWDGKSVRRVFGIVTNISGNKITLEVADEVQAPEITGIHDGDVLEVELEDLFGSEWSPFACYLEKLCKVEEEERAQAESKSKLISICSRKRTTELNQFAGDEPKLTKPEEN